MNAITRFINAVHNYAEEINQLGIASGKLNLKHQILTGLAVGAISLITLGIATKPLLAHLVTKFQESEKTDTISRLGSEKILQKKIIEEEQIDEKDITVINDKKDLATLDPNVTKIRIADPSMMDSDLEDLKKFTKLESLHLSGAKISDAPLAELLDQLPHLTTLSLKNSPFLNGSFMARLTKKSELTSIDLSGSSQITVIALIAKITTKNFTALKSINVTGCKNLANMPRSSSKLPTQDKLNIIGLK